MHTIPRSEREGISECSEATVGALLTILKNANTLRVRLGMHTQAIKGKLWDW
jgi:hypothetical protein